TAPGRGPCPRKARMSSRRSPRQLQIQSAQQIGLGLERRFGVVPRLRPGLTIEQAKSVRRASEHHVLGQARPLAQRRWNQHASLIVEFAAVRGSDEKVLELQYVRVETVEFQKLFLELEPGRNGVGFEKTRRAQRMGSEEHGRTTRDLNQITECEWNAEASLRIEKV